MLVVSTSSVIQTKICTMIPRFDEHQYTSKQSPGCGGKVLCALMLMGTWVVGVSNDGVMFP